MKTFREISKQPSSHYQLMEHWSMPVMQFWKENIAQVLLPTMLQCNTSAKVTHILHLKSRMPCEKVHII